MIDETPASLAVYGAAPRKFTSLGCPRMMADVIFIQRRVLARKRVCVFLIGWSNRPVWLKKIEGWLVDLPKVAALTPEQIQLVAGQKYAFCSCGLSNSQPLCDGSHKGTDFKPLVFTAEESKSAWFCRCKKSCRQPYCDGTHKQLSGPSPGAIAIE